MSNNRLDGVSRVLARGLSRRQALRQLGAVMVAGGAALAEPEIAGAAGPAKCAKGTTQCCICVSTSIDPNNCGACGHVCSFPNATASCVSGTCQIASCNAGFANCNAVASDGCEVNLNTDPNNCGACGTVCSVANASSVSCTGGRCSYTCAAGFANCSGTGCTTNVSTDVNNCGSCANKCSSGQSCVNGTCTGGGLANGATCTSNSQCSSGACVPSATNPSSSICCATACTAAGGCGTTGFCSTGGMGCQVAASGTACSAASCSGNVFTPAGTCDGTGNCTTPPPITCSGSTSACDSLTGCVTCITAGHPCSAATGAAQCCSSQCVSGVCV